MGGGPRRLAARGAPGLVRALRSLLPLARARPLGVRGHRGGDPAPAHDRRPGGASLPGIPQALPGVGLARPGNTCGTRRGAQAARALAPEGAGAPAPPALPRGAARPHAGNAPGIRAPAGHRPVYGERRAGRRLRASGAAPRCQPGPTPGAVLWPLPDLIAEQPPAAASDVFAAPRAG